MIKLLLILTSITIIVIVRMCNVTHTGKVECYVGTLLCYRNKFVYLV